MNAYLVVFAGAGLGGALRHTVNLVALRLLGHAFPFGTLAVNVGGSLIMGVLANIFALKADPGQTWRLFLTTGMLGGFTTFSAFSLDAAVMIERGTPILAAGYILTSVAGSLAGFFLGLLAVRHLA
jgi:fluoride exporter